MTRKDYIILARGLSSTYHSACESKQSPDVLEAILRTAYSVASELAKDNPRFNGTHFMRVVRGVKDLHFAAVAERGAIVNCDHCQLLSVNGIPCHEIGCPNQGKRYVYGAWICIVVCLECGCEVEEGTVCDCQEPMPEPKEA